MSSFYDDPELFAILVFFGIVGVISLINLVLSIVGKWKIFTKAGREGWPAIIPIYNQVVLCQISGVSPWWVLIRYLSIFVIFIPFFGTVAQLIANIYFLVLLNVSLARSFGKSDGWAVGLILLEPYFLFALGIGSSEYLGMRPMEDVIFKNLNVETPEASVVEEKEETTKEGLKYCPSCGTKIEKGSKYCTNCGEKL